MEIPVIFFHLIGVAAVIAAAGWALPRIFKAWGELPPDPLDKVIENISKDAWHWEQKP